MTLASSLALFAQEPSFNERSRTFVRTLSGEFEYAVSNLGKPNFGAGRIYSSLWTIALFINDRQPLEPKHLELLETHRDDLELMLQNDSLKPTVACLLMWMNLQANKSEPVLVKSVDGFEQSKFETFLRFSRIIAPYSSQDFRQALVNRYANGNLQQAEQVLRSLELDFPKVQDMDDATSLIPLPADLTPGHIGISSDRMMYMDRQIDFEAELEVAIDVSRPIDVRTKSAAETIKAIASQPLTDSDLRFFSGKRDTLHSLAIDAGSDSQLRAMLAELVLWLDARSGTRSSELIDSLRSLDQSGLLLLMLHAPMLDLQQNNDIQQVIIDRFAQGDNETAQLILDVLEMYTSADVLKLSTAIDLFVELASRPTISTSEVKQMMVMLKDLHAKNPR
jgi:hypothetical protein